MDTPPKANSASSIATSSFVPSPLSRLYSSSTLRSVVHTNVNSSLLGPHSEQRSSNSMLSSGMLQGSPSYSSQNLDLRLRTTDTLKQDSLRPMIASVPRLDSFQHAMHFAADRAVSSSGDDSDGDGETSRKLTTSSLDDIYKNNRQWLKQGGSSAPSTPRSVRLEPNKLSEFQMILEKHPVKKLLPAPPSPNIVRTPKQHIKVFSSSPHGSAAQLSVDNAQSHVNGVNENTSQERTVGSPRGKRSISQPQQMSPRHTTTPSSYQSSPTPSTRPPLASSRGRSPTATVSKKAQQRTKITSNSTKMQTHVPSVSAPVIFNPQLQARATREGTIQLDWDAVPKAAICNNSADQPSTEPVLYTLYRSRYEPDGRRTVGSMEELFAGTNTGYIDSGLALHVLYGYTLVASCGDAFSDPSNVTYIRATHL